MNCCGRRNQGITQRIRDQFFAAAHDRLSQPLYCIAFALIAHGGGDARAAPARQRRLAPDHGQPGGGGPAHRRLWRDGRWRSTIRRWSSLSICCRCWARPRHRGAGGLFALLHPRTLPGAGRMSWSWTLYRYLAVQFLLGVTVVYALFLTWPFPSTSWTCSTAPPAQCVHLGGDRHGGAATAGPGPEDAALRHPAGRGVHLRAPVAVAASWWRPAPPASRPGISCCRRSPWRC